MARFLWCSQADKVEWYKFLFSTSSGPQAWTHQVQGVDQHSAEGLRFREQARAIMVEEQRWLRDQFDFIPIQGEQAVLAWNNAWNAWEAEVGNQAHYAGLVDQEFFPCPGVLLVCSLMANPDKFSDPRLQVWCPSWRDAVWLCPDSNRLAAYWWNSGTSFRNLHLEEVVKIPVTR